ncbi:ATP-binding protein [Mesorhizobium sp. L-8-3]|uniref:ATP-binding protein n=1 Tax=Mesorhizobium sp. L-8-3 TaxID=2744522 RepID=UPI00237A28B0|nr:ATP-binding protein [Mesorhizobium sp. L-8-3]
MPRDVRPEASVPWPPDPALGTRGRKVQTDHIGDRLRRQATRVFVGRASELARLQEVLAPVGPCVVLLHGLSGIGKTSLLRQFAGSARDRGATVIELDGRQIEPTEQGFLRELGTAIGTQCNAVQNAARRLAEFDASVVIAVAHSRSFA